MLNLGQTILKWLFYPLIEVLGRLCDGMVGLWTALFGGDILSSLINSSELNLVFNLVMGISAFILMCISFYKITAYYVKGKQTLAHEAMKDGAYGLGSLLCLYIFIYLIGSLVTILSQGITDSQTTISLELFQLGAPNSIDGMKDINWTSFFSQHGVKYIPDYHWLDDYAKGWLDGYNFLYPILGGLGITVMLGYFLFISLKRFFNIAVLFVLGPVAGATYPLSHGQGLKNWAKDFISVSATGLLMYISFNLAMGIKTIMTKIVSDISIVQNNRVLQLIVPLLLLFMVFYLTIEVTNKLAEMFNLNVQLQASFMNIVGGIVSSGKNAVGKVKNAVSKGKSQSSSDNIDEKENSGASNTSSDNTSYLNNQIPESNTYYITNSDDDIIVQQPVAQASGVVTQTASQNDNTAQLLQNALKANLDLDLSPVIDVDVEQPYNGFGENDYENQEHNYVFVSDDNESENVIENNIDLNPNIEVDNNEEFVNNNDVNVNPNIEVDNNNNIDVNTENDIQLDNNIETDDQYSKLNNNAMNKMSQTLKDIKENTSKGL